MEANLAPKILSLIFLSDRGEIRRDVAIKQTVIAGFTGRDREAVEKHIAELEAIGVRRPSTTPIFYNVAASRVATDDTIDVVGSGSSGEVEFVLLQSAGRLWVGVGSDHTDRVVEAFEVGFSKQVCEKPVAPVFWAFEDVAGHWDRLTLSSFLEEEGGRALYQEGSVATMMAPGDLIARFAPDGSLLEGTLMFCGTLAAKGGIRGGTRFEYELDDPVLGRTIRHAYRVTNLLLMR